MRKDKVIAWIIFIAQYILIPLLILGFIVLEIYAFVKYGDKPITEIPTWVFWLIKK